MSNKYAAGRIAIAECDRCGQRYKLKQLKELIIRTKKTSMLVCPTCWEPDHPQTLQGMYPVQDPQALKNPRRDNSYLASGLNVNNYIGEGSRIFQWGFHPVGGGTGVLTPNDLISVRQTGTVGVTV